MVALRSVPGRDEDERDAEPRMARPNPADWLTLQQAACELGVSASTARRMIRKGKLRNRVVPRPGGFAYLVYMPNSRHATALSRHGCAPLGDDHSPLDLDAYRQQRSGSDERVRALERQVEQLSDALSRALLASRRKGRAAGARVDRAQPFAQYRALVRRRRWWPFT